jgi:hypothetical protein
MMSEEELEGMQEEDLEEHKVVEEFIVLAHREEEEVHRAVGESFIYLHEDWLRAWLMAKNKEQRYQGNDLSAVFHQQV